MKPGFQQATVLTRTGDGLNDTLCESLVFLRRDGSLVRAPSGGTTDGLSVPRCVQNIIPASGGGSWMCGVLHDSCYRNQMQRWDVDAQDWLAAKYTREQSDDLFLEAMELQGVPWFKRKMIYRAVRLFGSSSYFSNRS